MHTLKNVEIIKEVDSFIAQAKLEGDISGSSSSNISINVHSTNEIIDDQIAEQNRKNLIKITPPRTNINSTDVKIVKDSSTPNCFIEHEKIISQLKNNKQVFDTNLNNNISNMSLMKEEYYISKQDEMHSNGVKLKDGSLNPKIYWKKNNARNYSGKEDEDSCDSSFVDIGNDSSRSQMPYIMWLQDRRSKQNLLKNVGQDKQTDINRTKREEVHLHQVSSALFWERWMDYIFDMYDQWVQSSDSDDNNNVVQKSYSKDLADRNQPTKIRSEPTIRAQPDKLVTHNLKYKSPSYVDWLVQKRQERRELSDSEEVIEPKINNSYWSSLYGKLTKSLSSIFLTPSRASKEDAFSREEQAESVPVGNKSSGSPSGSPRVTSTGLRRSHSHSCSHNRHGFNHQTKLRCRQLSQDSVGSPVLTDQLVELVCNTLSPESSDDSDSEEDVRRRKPYRRITKRKS